jgi:hypothetical protein
MSGDLAAARESASQLAPQIARLRGGGATLRSLPAERRVAALAQALRMLADGSSALGAACRRHLPASTGLSQPMVDWALRTTLGPLTRSRLGRAVAHQASARRRLVPPRLTTVVLAGNVFTAGLGPIALALLHGSPVAIKASSREETFPSLLAEALGATDPLLGDAVAVIRLPRDAPSLEQLLWSASDVVVAYGRDETMHALRQRVPEGVRLVEHGHGLGVAYVGGAALRSEATAARAATALALDVAAYDQRGCLSPQCVWVETRGAVDGRQFARLLDTALGRLEHRLPRGPLPPLIAAEQMQWRAVGAATGEIAEGSRHAVAYRGRERWRTSPGWRNLDVLECDGPEQMIAAVTPLATQLKAIGLAGAREERRSLAAHLPPPLCPRLSPLGSMQRPDVFGWSDGVPADAGLLRWMEIAP